MLYILLIVVGCSDRNFSTPKKYIEISNLNERIRNVLNEDWILITEGFSTSIYFCPTCNDPDSTAANSYDSFIFPQQQLKLKGPDSVTFLSAVNPASFLSDDDKKASYKPEGILKITIDFEDEWSDQKYQKIKGMNDTLIAALKKKGYTPERLSSFSDFRANIPDTIKWKKFLNEYDFYFQRLPYKSTLINKSILLNGELPNDWSYPFYVDQSDSLYYLNNENNMFAEYGRVLFSIAYALGVDDY